MKEILQTDRSGLAVYGFEPGRPARINVGCGEYHLDRYLNIDANPVFKPDLVCQVPPLPFPDNSLDEIYAGHFLEHLQGGTPGQPTEAAAFLMDCYRCLKPGGLLGLVVPDTREIMRRYLDGSIDHVEYPHYHWWPIADLDAVGAMFLYSTAQGSHHRWSYDKVTLGRAMAVAGFVRLREFHRFSDSRLACGAWYNLAIEGNKPEDKA